jgi:hypothetical protein
MTTVTGVPLTRFASELRASPWQFDRLTEMPFLASLLSLPASVFIKRTAARPSRLGLGLPLMAAAAAMWTGVEVACSSPAACSGWRAP